jgi:hypothetical protein
MNCSGVHRKAFPELDEKSEGAQEQENGPEETAIPKGSAITAAQVAKNQ